MLTTSMENTTSEADCCSLAIFFLELGEFTSRDCCHDQQWDYRHKICCDESKNKTAPGLKFNVPHLLAGNIWIIWSPGYKYFEKGFAIPIQWNLSLLRPNEITNVKTSCALIPLQPQKLHSKLLLRKSSKPRHLGPARLELINLT